MYFYDVLNYVSFYTVPETLAFNITLAPQDG